jgi:hypothetical protein
VLLGFDDPSVCEYLKIKGLKVSLLALHSLYIFYLLLLSTQLVITTHRSSKSANMFKSSLFLIVAIVMAFIGNADAKTKGFATGKSFKMSGSNSDCLFGFWLTQYLLLIVLSHSTILCSNHSARLRIKYLQGRPGRPRWLILWISISRFMGERFSMRQMHSR